MKKHAFLFLLVALLAALFAVPAFAGEPDWVTTSVCTGGGASADNTHSASVRVPRGVTTITMITPTITSATAGIEVSSDGTTFYTLKDFSNGTNLVAGTSAAGTGAQALKFTNMGAYRYVRTVYGAAQAADRTTTWWGTKTP